MQVGNLLFDDDDYQEDETPDVIFHPPEGMTVWPSVDEWGHLEWSTWLGQRGWTQEQVDHYLQVDRYKYGLGLRRTPKEGLTWFYLPIPAAVPLHAAKEANILYGGAAGGTKSHSTRWDGYRNNLTIPDFRSILMRRTYEELKRSHLDKAGGECERVNGFFQDVVMDLVTTEHELRFPKTGGKIIFGHCQNLGDEEKYLSDEYDEFRPDEAATFHKEQIVGVAGRLRSVKHGSYGRVKARLIATSNPGGAHTLWLKRWFIDKLVTRAENPKYKPQNYTFIPASLYDNPWLMDEDGTFTSYEDRLYAYSPARRRQLLLGDWSAITGQFFPEFVADPKIIGSHVADLGIPSGCRFERWIDWGYSPNPGYCCWVACFPNGRLYVFAEWVFNGEGRTLHVASDVAKRINRMTVEEVKPAIQGTLRRSIGDPSMWAKDGHSGEAYEETFRRNGVAMQRGDNDRFLGWGRMRHWLRPHPESGRWLMFHPDCRYAIRTLPTLVHDKNNPDDCDTSGEDHGADAIRYGLMARPTPTVFGRSVTPLLPESVREMLNSLLRTQNRPFGMVM